MSSFPSTSYTNAPSARDTTYGVPPTALNARIDELTPPGITCAERSNKTWLEASPTPRQTVAVQPAVAHALASQRGIGEFITCFLMQNIQRTSA